MSAAIKQSRRFAVSRGEKPQFHVDPAIDDLMSMVVALTSEVAVLRERLDTHERLSASAGGYGPEQVDHFQPDPDGHSSRSALRQDLVSRVFRAALASDGGSEVQSHASIVAEIESGD